MSVQFDPDFVQTLREETELDNLDVVWNDRVQHVGRQVFGAWMVIQRIDEYRPEVIDGALIMKSEVEEYGIFPCDGNHGLPTYPGRWLIEALLQSDPVRNQARFTEVDDWREAKVAREQKFRDDFAREKARDKDLYKAFQEYGDAFGTETPLKEELIAMEREAVKAMEEQAKWDLYDRRNARMHDGKQVLR